MDPRVAASVIIFALFSGCAAPEAQPPAGQPFHESDAVGAAFALERVTGEHAAEPHVVVRAEGTSHVVVVGSFEYGAGEHALRDKQFRLVVHRSLDGGVTWSGAQLPPEVRAPFDPLGRMGYTADPVLAYAPSGALYLAGVAADGFWKDTPGGFPLVQLNDLTLFVTRSSDDGATWSPALFHQAGAGTYGFPVLAAGTLEDKPWIAVGPDGVVHLTWTRFDSVLSSIRYARSDDDGATWSEPLTLAMARPGYNAGPEAFRSQLPLQASTVSAPGGGLVYVSATEHPEADDGPPAPKPGGAQLVWVSRDDGRNFEPPVRVGPATYDRYGTIVADPEDPQRAVVLAPEDMQDSRVWFATTRDGGRTWSEPSFVSEPRGGIQRHPTAWFDGTGGILVAYYDSGWPGGERLVLARIVDDAVVSEEVPDGAPIMPGFARREYIGLTGAQGSAWAAWVGGDDAQGTHIEVARIDVGAR